LKVYRYFYPTNNKYCCLLSILRMNRENGPGNIKKRPVASFQTMLLVLGASAISFLAGTQFAANFNQCSSLSSPQIIGADASKGISMVAEVSSRKPRQGMNFRPANVQF